MKQALRVLSVTGAGEIAGADVLYRMVEREKPAALLLPSTMHNRALAGELAAMTDAAVVTDAEELRVPVKDGCLVWKKSAAGGFLRTEVTGTPGRLQIGLVSSSFTAKESPRMVCEEVRLPDSADDSEKQAGYALKLLKKSKKPALDLEHAEVIVAGGRGVGGAEGCEMLRELAGALGGVVGASRFAVDQGWVGKESLVGQSGKTVRPRLYIACGISGSVQHITGMRNAGCVVSVNTDKKALIFNVSDYCIVGDLFEIVPRLTKLAKER